MRERPLLIYDGQCRFCRLWIERWRAITQDRVDYEPSEAVAGEFSDITESEFAEAVQWAGQDGLRATGAEAVFRALATSTWLGKLLLYLQLRAAPFRWFANLSYRFVAANRGLFFLLTRLLWGTDVRPPTYAISTWLFLRVLGVTYLIAFVSFWIQADGLIGEQGILPAADFFDRAGEALGKSWFVELPSFCWWNASNAALTGWCIAGIAAAICLIAGVLPAPMLFFLWVNYLSLCGAGQIFYQYQWDILLLETGFLAIFAAPWKIVWLKPVSPPRLARWLLVWLLIRLMFASGVVKLTSGDSTWENALALTFHYYTQPIPTPLAWYAHQLPDWFQAFSVRAMFGIELVCPWLLLAPRNPRLAGAAALAGLQMLIAVTGNYGFFNWLSIALCLLAVDDLAWSRVLGKLRGFHPAPGARFLHRYALLPVAGFLFLLTLPPFYSAFRCPFPDWMKPLVKVYEPVSAFRSINGYGLFAVMTTERREIIVQGSDDGINWKTYTFRYKPGDPMRAPPWVAPHMPRLDWQMWFAALGSIQHNPWFLQFVEKLLRGSPSVTALLENNPFPDKPPKYVRALCEDYKFTNWEQRKESGNWWRTETRAPYCPPLSLRQ